jgi:hypothetical protein
MLFGAAAIVTSPFWGPPVMLHDNYELQGYFPRSPYGDSPSGYMMIEPDLIGELYPWSLRGRVDYLDTFDNVRGVSGQLIYECTSRFGIDTQLANYWESLPSGDRQDLWVGDFNVVYRFAQSERLMMRTGLGANWLANEGSGRGGFNFTYGGEWFPVRPLVVSAEMDLGTLGHATLFHGRATAGVQFHGIEVYAGFDYLDVGNAQLNSVVSGLRVWY